MYRGNRSLNPKIHEEEIFRLKTKIGSPILYFNYKLFLVLSYLKIFVWEQYENRKQYSFFDNSVENCIVSLSHNSIKHQR